MRLPAILVALASLLPMQPGQAMTVGGLPPGAPLVLKHPDVRVDEHTLIISQEDLPRITVSPWPDFLPMRFPPAKVFAERRLDPGGPSDRITLTCGRNSRPFIMIAHGARSGSDIATRWKLSLSRTGIWSVRERATGRRNAVQAGSTMKSGRWTLYILETSRANGPATAGETVPALSWVAIGRACK